MRERERERERVCVREKSIPGIISRIAIFHVFYTIIPILLQWRDRATQKFVNLIAFVAFVNRSSMYLLP